MSRWYQTFSCNTNGFPRVSGDEPLFDERAAIYRVFSPRERG